MKIKHILLLALLTGIGGHCFVQTDSRPQSNIVGNDRDADGCIGSAGYTWSQIKKDCIRLFEEKVQLRARTHHRITSR